MSPASDRIKERQRMVETQILARGIRETKIVEAMLKIPRELFVPAAFKAQSYEDQALPIEAHQTISQPYIVALMAQALELKGHENVLEVGTGSGYSLAVLSHLCRNVFGIELNLELKKSADHRFAELKITNAKVKQGDGSLGWPEFAPFDGISVAAGAKTIPPQLLEQLSLGGRLVIPVGATRENQRLLKITKLGFKDFKTIDLGAVAFVPFIGEQNWTLS